MQEINLTSRTLPTSMDGEGAKRTPRLRPGGLYTLRDGSELVVGVGRENHYFLYHPRVWAIQAWVVSMPVSYEISLRGELVTGAGEPTRWSVEDLIDTGRTAERLPSR